jgi:hypothetical protein
VLVTSAQRSRQEELAARVRRYTWTMGVRTACFLLAVMLPIPLAWKIPFVIGGMTLPWMAVTVANAGPVRQKDKPVGYAEREHEARDPLRLDGHTVIDG